MSDAPNPRPKSYPTFQFALTITLVLGAIICEMSYSPKSMFTALGLYVAGLAFQILFFDSRYFAEPGTAGHRQRAESHDEIIYAGKPLETEAAAEREKKALEGVLHLSTQLKIRIGSVAMLIGFGTVIANRLVVMHVTLVLHLVASLMTVPAMTIYHFTLPLLANLLAVAYSLSKTKHADWGLYAVYLAAFLFTLIAQQNTLRELRQSRPRAIAVPAVQRRGLVSAVQLAVLYLVVFALVEHFVPRPAEGKAKPSVVQSRVKDLRMILNKATATAPPVAGAESPSSQESGLPTGPSEDKMEVDGGAKASLPQGAPSAGGSSRPDASASETPPLDLANLKLPQGAPSFAPEDIQKLAQQAMQMGLLDEKMLSQGKLDLKPEVRKMLTPQNMKAAQQLLKKMAADAKLRQGSASSSLPAGIGGATGPSGGSGPSGRKVTKMGPNGRPIPVQPSRAAKADPKAMRQMLKATQKVMREAIVQTAQGTVGATGASGAVGASGVTGAGGVPGAPGPTGSSGFVIQASGASGALGPSSVTAVDADFDSDLASLRKGRTGSDSPGGTSRPEPSPSKKPEIDPIERLLTPFLVLFAAVAVYLFRRKVRKQADPAKVHRGRLASEQRAEILHALREITRRKLSPREEIIVRYDLFCRIMEMARTPREASLPPTDFHRRIGYLHPKLEGNSKRITDTFCDTFYGELDVADERVRDCRSAVKDVFHYFAD